MQTVARQSTRTVVARSTRVARVANVRVVAKASAGDAVKKATAFAAGLPVMIASNPAYALVDERMNGDGTSLPLGINEGVLGWCMAAVALGIWTMFYISQRELGDYEDVDAGLRIDDGN